MTLERHPKPPLGTAPFHIFEMERDVCGLCGISRQVAFDEYKEICPVILAANRAAGDAWEAIINPHLE